MRFIKFKSINRDSIIFYINIWPKLLFKSNDQVTKHLKIRLIKDIYVLWIYLAYLNTNPVR